MPSPQKALNLNALLLNIKDSYQFRDLAAILKENEIVTAAGWDPLLEKLQKASGDVADRAHALFAQLISDLRLAGTKDAFIYELDEQSASDIQAAFIALECPKSDFLEAYPLTLSETKLHQKSTDHELTHKYVHANGDVSLILCTKRTEEDRVTYKSTEVSEAVRAAFDGYHEFIAIKSKDYQAFDVATIRKSLRRLEILVDQPSRIRLPHSSDARHNAVLGRLSTLDSSLAAAYESNAPLDLSPCINNLYSAPREGRVTQLSFRTPTKSVNKGALPNEDLRQEPFHKNGVQAVGTITPYDITITWDTLRSAQGPVSVQVGMPLTALSLEGPQVRHARIGGARSDATILAVVNKLVSYSSA